MIKLFFKIMFLVNIDVCMHVNINIDLERLRRKV